MWTVEMTKKGFPKFSVELGDGTTVEGFLLGRKLEYPKIGFILHESYLEVEVSWDAVRRARETDRPIKV